MGELLSMNIHEWNATLEKPIKDKNVFRIRYTGRAGFHADQLNNINPQQTNYVWFVTLLVAVILDTAMMIAVSAFNISYYSR